MNSTLETDSGFNLTEHELSKADSVITAIQQHYFYYSEEAIRKEPWILVYQYEMYSNFLDISLDLVRSAKEALATLRQNVEGGAIND